MDNSMLAGIILLLGGFLFIFFIIGIVFYILMSVGLQKLAKNAGIENSWLAWIPIANLYILGLIVKSLKLGSLEIPRLEIVLPVSCIATYILSYVPAIGGILGLVYCILLVLVLYRLFNMYRPQQAILWTVLSVIFAWIAMPAILIFVMRNDSPAIK